MDIFCVNPNADLYEKLPIPKVPELTSTSGQITVGDLHGNAAKLLFILFEHGIASGLNDYEYTQLLSIYKTPVDALIEQQLIDFSKFLDQIKFAKGYSLRLIGDELCDRGENDYFTLLILERLKKDVAVDILLSNHGILFVQAYALNDFSAVNLYEGQEQSMHNMHKLLKNGMIQWSRVREITNWIYIPSLKLIDYVLSWDNKQLVIFTHAPAGLEAIEAVARIFQIPYNASSVKSLVDTIESINGVIAYQLQVKNFHRLYDMRGNYTQASLENDPILYLMWNRKIEHINQPQEIGDCRLTFVNGHDGNSGQYNNRICLNDLLGKSLFHKEALIGAHSFVYLPGAVFNLEHVTHEDRLYQEIALLQKKLNDARDELRNAKADIVKLQGELELHVFQNNTFSTMIHFLTSDIKKINEQVYIGDQRYRKKLAENEALIIDKQKKLDDVLNDERELSCQLAVHNKLIPFTERYLGHLISHIQRSLTLNADFSHMKLPAQVAYINAINSWPTDKSTELLEKKFKAIQHLYTLLRDGQMMPRARVDAFDFQLRSILSIIEPHRDPQWMRYMLNVALVLTIILTGVVPGLAVLGIMALNDKPVCFWQSSGQTFFNAVRSDKLTGRTSAAEDSQVTASALN